MIFGSLVGGFSMGFHKVISASVGSPHSEAIFQGSFCNSIRLQVVMDNNTFYDNSKPRWLFNSLKQANRAQLEQRKRLPGYMARKSPIPAPEPVRSAAVRLG
jgi:hypothetical protein